MIWHGVISHYRDYLPITEKTPIITLKEGNTPLIEANNLSEVIGGHLQIYLKYEGLNPTCSFKDRGMTVAVSKAVEEGASAIICASTGNTSASAAAYAAKAKIDCVVLIPKGEIAMGKLAQALMHNAKVLAVEGNFDDALELVRIITSKYPIALVNSINPYRIEGQKTGAFEICDHLGRAPEYHAIPVGNAGNITAYWKGYKEYKQRGMVESLPKMLGFQAVGAAPIVTGHPIEKPKTIATAIKIGNPASWKSAEAARDESDGLIDTVTDDEILTAYKMLAGLEGIFVEPASAASVAGVIKLNKRGYFKKSSTIACVLTGHGLKDPDRALQTAKEPIIIPATEAAVIETVYYAN
ncbi:threonine synthase [Candidatus Poribacteria bacterium]|nr:threonine synthase [Candidatus Poribacteria bacterium]